VTEPLLPPCPTSPSGEPRRVGAEIEYTGPGCFETAELVRELFGGSIEQCDDHRYEVTGGRLGDFRIELDMTVAHPKEEESSSLAPVRSAIGSVGSLVMPFEIVTPPVRIEELGAIEELVRRLRMLGARGTERSPLYAFGLHLNPEVASFKADRLVDVMKAFALLAPWLRSVVGVDLSRRLAPFIQPWPETYVGRLVDPGYRPDLPELIEDYLAANPTRNRELDLFPLFAHLDRDRVLPRDMLGLVKPRPTWHYRLPDSRVDRTDWGIVADWNRWIAVERLAADRERLDRMGEELAPRLSGR
jgi:hypothetical protein